VLCCPPSAADRAHYTERQITKAAQFRLPLLPGGRQFAQKQHCERRNRQELLWLTCQFGIKLEQSQMVGIPGLQRTHQEFKVGKHT
jgi:hypothetical protein